MDSQLARPAVSVIIPVYNAEAFLPACSESLLGQSFRDWEAVCIDDGSTDASLDILTDYAARDARFRVLTQQNRGQGAARNRGMREARGKWLAFLDADDYLAADFLEELYAAAEAAQADVVMGTTVYEGTKKRKRRKRKQRLSHLQEAPPGSFRQRVMNLRHGGAWDKLYRTSWVLGKGIFFPEGVFWEDNLFTVQSCYYARVFVTAPKAVYHYVQHPVSTTHNAALAVKRKEDSLAVGRSIMQFVSRQGCSQEEVDAVSNFCLRNFVRWDNLQDEAYFTASVQIFGCAKYLRRLRRKSVRSKMRQCIRFFLKEKLLKKLLSKDTP